MTMNYERSKIIASEPELLKASDNTMAAASGATENFSDSASGTITIGTASKSAAKIGSSTSLAAV